MTKFKCNPLYFGNTCATITKKAIQPLGPIITGNEPELNITGIPTDNFEKEESETEESEEIFEGKFDSIVLICIALFILVLFIIFIIILICINRNRRTSDSNGTRDSLNSKKIEISFDRQTDNRDDRVFLD